MRRLVVRRMSFSKTVDSRSGVWKIWARHFGRVTLSVSLWACLFGRVSLGVAASRVVIWRKPDGRCGAQHEVERVSAQASVSDLHS